MRATIVSLALAALGSPGLADDAHTIALVAGDGRTLDIGRLIQTGTTYRIDWNEAMFEDHFLSMRPFKCVNGGEKLWCHVPYPYEIARDIGAGDLTDLEYDLLFVWKGATDYGIDMWNGVYYRLGEDGNGWRGEMFEMDMGGLAVPPPPGELRPIRESDLHPADPDSHAFPQVVIR